MWISLRCFFSSSGDLRCSYYFFKVRVDSVEHWANLVDFTVLQELMLPFSIIAVNFQKLKRWEEPGATAGFLIAAMGIVYM